MFAHLGEERKARKCSRASFGCTRLRASALRAVVFECAPLGGPLTFLLQNLHTLPAGSPARQGQMRVTLANTVGADPFGVTSVTAVQANMREGGEANSGTPHLAQDMVHQHCGSPLPAPHWLPLELTDTGTQLSSPSPCSSEHSVALETTCGSHHPDIHSIVDFTAISPQTRQASGFQP